MAAPGPIRPRAGSTPAREPLQPGPSAARAPSAARVAARPPARRTGANRFFGRALESLGNRNYRYLWLSMMTGMSGTQMQFLARGILTYDLTGSFAITGLVGVGFAPASLFGSMIAGTITERVERRTLIQGLQFGQVVIAAVIAFLLIADMLIWQYLLIASIIQGTYFAFMMPARQVMIQKIVGRDLMSNAVSLNSAAMSMTTMVAPAVAGVLYSLIGPEGVYLIVAGLNVVALLFIGKVPLCPPDPDAPRRSMVSNIVEGFAYVRRYRELLSVLVFSGVVMILTMSFRMLLPAFAKDVYGAVPFQVGVLTAMTGIGSLFGALGMASLRRGQRRGAVLMGSAFVSAFSLALVAGLPFYWAGVFLMLLVGIGEAGRFALGQALAMELTDDEHRARVASIFEMTFGFTPLGIMSVAAAMEIFGAEAAIFGMAMVLLVVSTIFVVKMPRLRNFG